MIKSPVIYELADNHAAIEKIQRAMFIINMMNHRPQSMGLVARYNQSVQEIQEAAKELDPIAIGE